MQGRPRKVLGAKCWLEEVRFYRRRNQLLIVDGQPKSRLMVGISCGDRRELDAWTWGRMCHELRGTFLDLWEPMGRQGSVAQGGRTA